MMDKNLGLLICFMIIIGVIIYLDYEQTKKICELVFNQSGENFSFNRSLLDWGGLNTCKP